MNLLVQGIWSQVVEGFERLHGKGLSDLWLKHTRPLSFTKGLFVLGVPNLFIREWLDKKYLKDLETLFAEVTGCPIKMILKTDGYLYRLMKESQGAFRTERPPKEDDEPPAAQYVVRPENRLVYSAFERILRAPPGTFNPLYFYGPDGVGKSHLVRTFLSKAQETKRFSAWRSIDAEAFARGFSHAARVGERVRFRGEVLGCELLVIEDAHQLEGKLKIQMELLHILKYLKERSRQVVVTASCHPREIRFFQGPLASFLLSGLVVSVAGYSLNSVVEILSEHCKERGLQIAPPLIETVAQSSKGGLLGLMGLLEQVARLAELKGEAATPLFLKEHFPEHALAGTGEDSVERIILLVAERLKVDRELITSNVKLRNAVQARHLVIYLASSLLQTPSRRICRWLGHISPSIVPYARRKIEGKRRKDPEFNALVQDLQSEIQRGQRYLF